MTETYGAEHDLLSPTLVLQEGEKAPRSNHQQLAPGACVGRFVVVRFVAEGGMGALYKAYDPELDRTVALKILWSDEGHEGSGGSLGRERMVREARALARLSHPNVVALYDAGIFGEHVFLAMEFVEGTTLRRWLKAGKRTQAQILDVFFAAGDGLAAAHRAGLVHRDVKPDNVLLGQDGRVRVVDFGLARSVAGAESGLSVSSDDEPHIASVRAALEKSASRVGLPSEVPLSNLAASIPPPILRGSLAPGAAATQPMGLGGAALRLSGSYGAADIVTMAGTIVGTPRYMAPEQYGADVPDGRTDQFSFCVSLYEALYGVVPFGEGTPTELASRVRAGVIQPAPAGSSVPRWLRRVLQRGLAPAPANRFDSMEDLLAALRSDPNRKLRRYAVQGAIFAALLAVGGIGFARRETSQVCAGAERKLDGVWDETTRASVTSTFRTTNLPYAETASAAVKQALDGYTSAWVTMHRDACEATRLRGEQSEELLDRRMECLTRRLRDVREMSTVFAAATPDVVEHAVRASQSLPAISACADATTLRRATEAPRDPALRARIDDARNAVSRASALFAAGRSVDAKTESEGAVALAEATGNDEVRGEALLVYGRIQTRLAEYKAAETAFHNAWIAGESAQADRLVAEVRVELVRLLGVGLARYGEASDWSHLARASLARLDGEGGLTIALNGYDSELLLRQGKLEDALAGARATLDLATRLRGAESLEAAGVQKAMGAIFYSLGRTGEAVESSEHALTKLRKLLGPEHPEVVDLMVNVGDFVGQQGHHEEALVRYRAALEILERIVGPDLPPIARLMNNMGDDLRAVGRLSEAHEAYTRALRIWEKRLGPTHPVVAVALHNLGEERLEAGFPREAEELLSRALTIRLAALGPNHLDVATDRAHLADALFAQGKLEAARVEYETARLVWEKGEAPDHPELAHALIGLARVQMARHENAAAIVNAEKALTILETSDDAEARSIAEAKLVLTQAAAPAGKAAPGAPR